MTTARSSTVSPQAQPGERHSATSRPRSGEKRSQRRGSKGSPSAGAAGAAYYVALILPLGAACWVFPILSRCAMSFGALNKTALKFAAGHLPSTVVLVLMTAEIARLSVRWLFPLAFMPAVLMLLWSLFTEPAFKKHGAGIAAETERENTEDAADASEKE